jgi:hypothetical protein
MPAKTVGIQGAPRLETPRWTKTKAVAEEMPSTDAACITAVEEVDGDVPVSDGGREADAPGARHGGDGLTLDKLEGLRRPEEAFGEQKGCMKKAWDDAMVSVKNELVFTELDTLVMVAREAVDRVIGTSARFVKEAQDQVPGAPDARGRRRPPHTMQPEGRTLTGQDVHNRCVDRNCDQFARTDEEWDRSVRSPNQGALVPNQKSQMQIGPCKTRWFRNLGVRCLYHRW